jgi:hypothetical protein
MALESPVQRDGDRGFIGFASRLNPLTLPAGMLQLAENVRLDRGVAQVRKGAKRLATGISTADSPLVLDFALAGDVTISTITRSGTLASVTTSAAHGYAAGNKVNIRGASDPLYNGDFTIANASGTTFEYTMTGTPAADATGTLRANKGPIVRNVYTGGIFAAGVYASKNYDSADEYIVLVGPDRAFLWREDATAATSSGLPEVTYPTSSVAEIIEPTDTVSVVQAFDRLYILREADQTVTGWGSKAVAGSGITVSTTTATVNCTAHGYSAGMRVRIEGSSVAAFAGHEYDIQTVAGDGNSFTITVPSGTAADSTLTGRTVRRVKPPIYWTGSGNFVRATAGIPSGLPATYKSMRSVGWASFISNRLVIPDGRDQVLISDYLDADTYDPFWSSFRAGSGGNDFIVAVHPWVEGTALVFCRKSIWLATLADLPSTDGSDFAINTAVAKMELVTDEIGCSARNSIVTAGNFVFFLSDAGVYRLDAKLDLKLRGDTRPLSDPIADLFASVNSNRVNKAFALWHDNRYLLALPTTTDAADGNDLVVCWNALMEQWEYRDRYSIGVDQIAVASYGNRRRVFNIRNSGSLYLLDEKDSGMDDTASVGTEFVVTGKIKTRRYDFGDMHSKRFLRVIADVVLPSGSTVTSKIATVNPDTENTIGVLTNTAGFTEDYNMKAPVRYKAHAAEVIYEATSGRPEIRSASIEASPKSLPPTETRNAA